MHVFKLGDYLIDSFQYLEIFVRFFEPLIDGSYHLI